ncbi:hypothetical protein D3C80_832240 [compost metagenome]
MGGVGDLAQQVHIAFVRGHDVEGDRAERRQARGLQHQGRRALRQVRAVRADMRRHQSCATRQLSQLGDEFVSRAVRGGARVLLIGNDDIADETFDAFGDGAAQFEIILAHEVVSVWAQARAASSGRLSAMVWAWTDEAVPRAIRPLMPWKMAASRNMLNAM